MKKLILSAALIGAGVFMGNAQQFEKKETQQTVQKEQATTLQLDSLQQKPSDTNAVTELSTTEENNSISVEAQRKEEEQAASEQTERKSREKIE